MQSSLAPGVPPLHPQPRRASSRDTRLATFRFCVTARPPLRFHAWEEAGRRGNAVRVVTGTGSRLYVPGARGSQRPSARGPGDPLPEFTAWCYRLRVRCAAPEPQRPLRGVCDSARPLLQLDVSLEPLGFGKTGKRPCGASQPATSDPGLKQPSACSLLPLGTRTEQSLPCSWTQLLSRQLVIQLPPDSAFLKQMAHP
ncbi:hypothetical protein H8959_017556 [Pygathrix nigripes]